MRFNPIWGGYGIWSLTALADSGYKFMFQSYLRWIWYLKRNTTTQGLLQNMVSILFEVDMVFEVYQISWFLSTIPSFNPIWGGYGIWSQARQNYGEKSTVFQSYLRWIWYLKYAQRKFNKLNNQVSILFEVDMVFEEFKQK